MHDTNEHLFIATPMSTAVDAEFHRSLLQSTFWDLCHDRRLLSPDADELNVFYASLGPQLALLRNMFVIQFLNQHHADWLLFCDDDMVFAPDAPAQLLACAHAHDQHIVGGYCMSVWQMIGTAELFTAPTLFVWDDDAKDQRRMTDDEITQRIAKDGSLVQVDATGAGFLLIHRKVFEDIADMDGNDNEIFTWFEDRELERNPFSEDITFCMRAIECGYSINVDTDVRIYHRKVIAV